MRPLGIEHVLVTSDKGFERELGKLAAELGATAVFDGVGATSPAVSSRSYLRTPRFTSTDSWELPRR